MVKCKKLDKSILFLMILLVFFAFSSSVLADTPVAQWNFNENTGTSVADSSGNGNNGTISELGTGVTWVSGINGSALKFDYAFVGQPFGYVNVPSSQTLNLTGGMTIEAWIRLTSWGNDTYGGIVSKYDGYGGYLLTVNNAQQKINFYLRANSTDHSGIPSDSVLDIDRWYYVVGVLDNNTNTMKIYVDGIQQTTIVNYTLPYTSDLNLTIGRYLNSNYQFNGTIDEVKIWNRALNDTEILSYYNTNKPPDTTPPTVNLVSPANNAIVSNATQTFWCNVSDAGGLNNITLSVWNSAGNLNESGLIHLWNKTFNDTGSSYGYDVMVDPMGNVYVVGSYTDTNTFLIKYSPDGTLLWNRSFYLAGISEAGEGVSMDSMGNLYVVGWSKPGAEHLRLFKVDSDGNLLWDKLFITSGSTSGRGIKIDASDHIYITGRGALGTLHTDLWLLKLDLDGNELWNKTFDGGTQSNDIGYDLAIENSSGNIYVVGDDGYDILILKVDTNGNLLWNVKTKGEGNNPDSGYALITDDAGSVYVLADTNLSSEGGQAWLLKYDSNGNHIWNRSIGGDYKEYVSRGIAKDSSGYIYVATTTNSVIGAGGLDIWILKYDSNGNLLWNGTLGGQLDDYVWGMSSDSSGNIYITGRSNSFGNSFYAWTLKYSTSYLQQTTSLSGLTNSTTAQFILPSEGDYTWSCRAYDNSGNYAWAGSNYTLSYSQASSPANETPINLSLWQSCKNFNLTNKDSASHTWEPVIAGLQNITGSNIWDIIITNSTCNLNGAVVKHYLIRNWTESGTTKARVAFPVWYIGSGQTRSYSVYYNNPLIAPFSKNLSKESGIYLADDFEAWDENAVANCSNAINYFSGIDSTWNYTGVYDTAKCNQNAHKITSGANCNSGKCLLLSGPAADYGQIYFNFNQPLMDPNLRSVKWSVLVNQSGGLGWYILVKSNESSAYQQILLNAYAWNNNTYTPGNDNIIVHTDLSEGGGSESGDAYFDDIFVTNTTFTHYDYMKSTYSTWPNETTTPPDTTPPIVNLVSPANNAIVSNATQTFWCNISDDVSIKNLTLFIWNSSNSNLLLIQLTNDFLSGTNDSASWNYTLSYQGTFTWSCLGYDAAGNSAWASDGNYSLNYTNITTQSDTTLPTINLISPANNATVNNITQSFWCNITDSALVSDVTLQLWNSTGNNLLSISWSKTAGGSGDDHANEATTDSSGNIYVTGMYDGGQLWLLKYDSNGNMLWNKIESYGPGTGIRLDSLGNIYVAGGDFFTLKYDLNGNILWNRTAVYGKGNGMTIDLNDNIYVVGEEDSFGAGSQDFWLLKYDSSGNLLWNRTAGGSGDDRGEGVITDSFENVYVTGWSNSFGNSTIDLWLIKYDSSGNILWNKTFGGADSGDRSYGQKIAKDSSDNIFVVGWTNSYSMGSLDLWLLKFDSDGNLLWNRTAGGSGQDEGHGVVTDVSGNVYVSGLTSSFGAGQQDVWLLKYDSDGNMLWNKTFGGSNDDLAWGLAIDSSGNLYIPSHTLSFSTGGRDVLLIKYPHNTKALSGISGSAGWNYTLPGAGNYTWSCLGHDAAGNAAWANANYTLTYDSCIPSLANTSWSAWQDIGVCLINDTKLQNRTGIQYDANYCGEIANTTIADYQYAACDFCTPSLTNTSWTAWFDTTACLANDTIYQQRNQTQYDTNFCGEVANVTFTEAQTIACDFCTPSLTNTSWSSWQNNGVCLINDTQLQNRTKIQYDINFCGEVSNTTYTEFQYIACDFCAPVLTNTTWTAWADQTSCLVNDTKLQNRSKIEYDANYCSEVSNSTSYEYQYTACDFCTPSLTNTSWSAWIDNSACLNNDTKLQNRTAIQSDTNFCGEVANSTVSENQYLACDFCVPSWNEINASCGITDQKIGWFNDSNACYPKTGLSADNSPPANNTYSCNYCAADWTCSHHNLTGDCLEIIDANYCYDVTHLTADNYTGDKSEFKTNVAITPIVNVSEAINGTNSNGTVTNSTINSSTVSEMQITLGNHNLTDWKTVAGTVEVGFLNGNKKIAEFQYNFTNSTINMNNISLEQGTSNKGAVNGYVLLRGINMANTVNQTKSLYLDNINKQFTWVCIKDEDINSISDIANPDSCNGLNEYKINCQSGVEKDGYKCAYDSALDQYKITGLRHSGIIQANCTESWSCTSWSACSGSTQTRICTDDNACGTNTTRPAESQSCTTTPTSSGGGGGSSGGGSSGDLGPIVTPKMSFDISEIKAGTPKSLTMQSSAIPVSAIMLTTNKDLSKVSMIVEALNEKPSTIDAPEGKVYKFISISKNFDNSDLSSAKIMFRVSKSWLKENSADESSVALQRYEYSTASKLPTTKAGETSTEIIYESTTLGFSYFVITAGAAAQTSTGTEGSSIIVSSGGIETPATSVLNPANLITGGAAAPQGEGSKPITFIIVTVVVASLITLVYFRYRKK